MYAAASQPERRVLNVPLRTLVDNNTLTGVEARLLSGSLNLRRTIIVSGGPNVGKSTLLNALVEMLPRDHRLVAVNDIDDELPALRDRSFAVQLTAKRGTPARANVFRKAADMKPTWIIAGELLRREGPAFFEAIGPGTAGLATVESPDPQLIIADWLSMSREVGEQLTAVKPLFAHMERDQGGRPRIQRLVEATSTAARPVLTTFRPVLTAQRRAAPAGGPWPLPTRARPQQRAQPASSSSSTPSSRALSSLEPASSPTTT